MNLFIQNSNIFQKKPFNWTKVHV